MNELFCIHIGASERDDDNRCRTEIFLLPEAITAARCKFLLSKRLALCPATTGITPHMENDNTLRWEIDLFDIRSVECIPDNAVITDTAVFFKLYPPAIPEILQFEGSQEKAGASESWFGFEDTVQSLCCVSRRRHKWHE